MISNKSHVTVCAVSVLFAFFFFLNIDVSLDVFLKTSKTSMDTNIDVSAPLGELPTC